MKIGYILRTNAENGDKRFKFREANATRTINSRGDMVRSKMLLFPVCYEEIRHNADIMKRNPRLMIVSEPFLLDDELRDKCTKWVEWANEADPSEYDPFAEMDSGDTDV